MPAPTLVDLCTKACVKNVRSLIDVGSFEYWQIRSVLQRVESPEQLHQIELNSPQLLGEDAELWQAFIARHIPNWQTKNYRPKNPTKWYEVYCKYKKEQKAEIARDEEILRTSMMGLQKARETNVSKIVDLKMLPKMPRDPRMMANNGGVPLKGKALFRKEGPSSLNWTSGSKTKMTDGKSVLTRARREAKEISQMGKLAKPTHKLALGHVQKAPAGMVKEYKTAAQPSIKILSKRHNPSSTVSGGVTGPSLEERERKLRAAMSGGVDTKHTMVGFSDDEDSDDNGDLFDESEPPKACSTPSRSSSSRPYQSISSAAASSSAKPRTSDIYASAKGKPVPASSPPSRPRASSPPRGGMKPMMPARRKAEVDVFNRGAKKRRVG
ncbi:RNA polymerase II transcription factor SIII subunit A [Diplocarpon rosae]|nr:RNA polymerase II transcription factor SIII subunit A [Diplocarpon rosae]